MPPISSGVHRGRAFAPSLDRGTLLVPGSGEGWAGSYYPSAGEAVIWRESEQADDPQGAAQPPESPLGRPETRAAPPGPASPPAAQSADERRSGPDDDVQRVARRARGRVRRYATANGCNRLATFTYAVGTHDRARVKSDWSAFARLLKARWPELAWVRVLELHPGGHGLHVHAGFSRFIPQGELAKLWGHGIVDVRKIRSRLPGRREAARSAARYLAKYATKARDTAPGEHGYEVAQGFQPSVVRVRSWDRASTLREVIRTAGGEVPAYLWSSDEDETWRGPPVIFAGW